MDNVNNIIYQAKFALKNNWLMAINILDNALKTFPDSEEIYMELAEIYHSKNAHKKTMDCYTKVLKINPQNDLARFKLGNLYLEMNEPKLAIVSYNKIKEDYPEALYNKAIAYRTMQKHDEAIKTLKELVTHSVQMINAYKYLVEILIMFGKTKEASKYVELAKNSFGNTCMVHYLRGLVFAREKNLIGAYHEYMIASREDAEYPHIHGLLGKLAEAIGQSHLVLKHLKNAVRSSHDNTNSINELVIHVVNNRLANNVDDFIALLDGFDESIVIKAVEKFKLQM